MTLRSRPAAGAADFRAAEGWIADLRRIDEAGCAPFGFSAADLDPLYADASADAMAAAFSAPGAVFRIVEREGRAVGCGGLVTAAPGTAELRRFYVDPAARGSGAGARLLSDLLADARAMGLVRARLETAVFLDAAIRLYRRHGFTPCPPFRDVDDGIDRMSVFLHCDPLP